MTEAKSFPTLERVLDSDILWGCLVTRVKWRRDKEGNMKKFGPYVSHVTKLPPDFSSRQCWDYIGKKDGPKHIRALRILKEQPLLPETKNPTDVDEIWRRINNKRRG